MTVIYGDVAGADEYHTARMNAKWIALQPAVKSSALIRASDYIRIYYVNKSGGQLTAITPEVIEATYIAALIEGENPGFFTVTRAAGRAKILTEVKGIKWTPITPNGDSSAGLRPISLAIEELLGSKFKRRITGMFVA